MTEVSQAQTRQIFKITEENTTYNFFNKSNDLNEVDKISERF